MGCSPSKGKLFSKSGGTGPQQPVVVEAFQDVDRGPVEVMDTCLKYEEKEDELPVHAEEQQMEEHNLTALHLNTTPAANTEEGKESEVNIKPEEIISDHMPSDNISSMKNQKKKHSRKRCTERQRKSSIKTKVDFPPMMVRAHQAAYTFLNPNISKYEALLGLLDQAAQTQMSFQPLISALVLNFEEINQALEEMAEEGELMIKEHGDYMALPSGMLGQATRSVNSSTNTVDHSNPPPDLLQQLLQSSTDKMKQVGGTFQTLGDSLLEESIEYFSTVSKLIVSKLHAKQAAEHRLSQVLALVEEAAIKKNNPEDSALHSEDSGIGGENDSLTGFERQRRHRGSAESGICGCGFKARGMCENCRDNASNHVEHNIDNQEENYDEEQDEDEFEDDDCDDSLRRRSNSCPPDPSQVLHYTHSNSITELQPLLKRPMTGNKIEYSSSSTCMTVMTELRKSHKELDQRMKYKGNNPGNPQPSLARDGLRRHSLNGSAGAHRSPMKAHHSPYLLSADQSQKRHSVRRLINTFSQGVDGRPGQSLSNIPPHIMGSNKRRILLLSSTINYNEEEPSATNTKHWTDGRDNLDADNLPPPPLEVLMDDSFQSGESPPENENLQDDSVLKLPMIHQKTGISQRKKINMKNVELLPNRPNTRSRPITVRQVGIDGEQHNKNHLETDINSENEKENALYQQAKKIIHLCNPAQSPDYRVMSVRDSEDSTSVRSTISQRSDSRMSDPDTSSCSPLVTAPPVSRVRLPPSCPSVRYRFPSPPAFRPQSTSRCSSRPNSPRRVTRALDKDTEEIIPSVSFHDARSVFCRNEIQNSQNLLSFGSSTLPRQRGEAARGRPLNRVKDSPNHRSQSEQRTSTFEPDDDSIPTETKGRESFFKK